MEFSLSLILSNIMPSIKERDSFRLSLIIWTTDLFVQWYGLEKMLLCKQEKWWVKLIHYNHNLELLEEISEYKQDLISFMEVMDHNLLRDKYNCGLNPNKLTNGKVILRLIFMKISNFKIFICLYQLIYYNYKYLRYIDN